MCDRARHVPRSRDRPWLLPRNLLTRLFQRFCGAAGLLRHRHHGLAKLPCPPLGTEHLQHHSQRCAQHHHEKNHHGHKLSQRRPLPIKQPTSTPEPRARRLGRKGGHLGHAHLPCTVLASARNRRHPRNSLPHTHREHPTGVATPPRHVKPGHTCPHAVRVAYLGLRRRLRTHRRGDACVPLRIPAMLQGCGCHRGALFGAIPGRRARAAGTHMWHGAVCSLGAWWTG